MQMLALASLFFFIKVFGQKSRNLMCDPIELVNPNLPIKVRQNASEIPSYTVDLQTQASKEFSVYFTFQLESSNTLLLKLLNISKSANQKEEFSALFGVFYDLQTQQFGIDFFLRRGNSFEKSTIKSPKIERALELEQKYFLSFSLNLETYKGSFYFSKNPDRFVKNDSFKQKKFANSNGTESGKSKPTN